VISTIAKRLGDELAHYFGSLQHETQDELSRGQASPQLQAVIEAALQRLHIVSRDEFDTQKAVLQRSRMRIEKLEQQIAELESHLEKQST